MKRTPFVAGNWKMNTTKAGAVALASSVVAGVAPGVKGDIQVGMAPPFVYLDAVGQALAGTPILLGAQDVYYQPQGAFTGEIAVDMLLDLGVKFCLTGHSERRHVLHEAGELIGKKATAVYNGGLILVHCVGETLAERTADQTLSVVERQLDELDDHVIRDAKRLVIAYEPVWAIGTGHTATSLQAQEVHAFIRQYLGIKWKDDAFGAAVRIQYGGSMKADNAVELLAQPDVDGGLIGGAALKADTFLPIINAAAHKYSALPAAPNAEKTK